jgi:hypothetical protein
MAHEQAEACAFARGKRKPARRRQVGHRTIGGEFGNDAGQRAAAQRLLHCPERIERARHTQNEESGMRHPEQVEAGTIGSASLSHCEIGGNPERLTGYLAAPHAGPYGKGNRKAAGDRQMDRGCGSEFMQRAEGKSAAERRVDRRDTYGYQAIFPSGPKRRLLA